MTTATADTLTPERAASTIATAAAFEEGLRHRTEGLTQMIWGIVSAAIFVTYGFAGASFADPWPVWANFLFAPWVAIGFLATMALWYSFALAAPLTQHAPSLAKAIGVYVVILALGWVGAWLLGPRMGPPAFFLLAVGTLWGALGALNVWKATPLGRRMEIAAGGTLIVSGLVVGALVADSDSVATVVAALVSGLVPVAAGAYHMTRG